MYCRRGINEYIILDGGKTFEDAIKDTIDWYLSNKKWWERIISGEYQKYYEKQYHS